MQYNLRYKDDVQCNNSYYSLILSLKWAFNYTNFILCRYHVTLNVCFKLYFSFVWSRVLRKKNRDLDFYWKIKKFKEQNKNKPEWRRNFLNYKFIKLTAAKLITSFSKRVILSEYIFLVRKHISVLNYLRSSNDLLP